MDIIIAIVFLIVFVLIVCIGASLDNSPSNTPVAQVPRKRNTKSKRNNNNFSGPDYNQ